MATVIQIKRSANATAPTTTDLVEGELAYSYDQTNNGASAKLYVEVLNSVGGEVIHAIGGKYYTDQIDNATNSNTGSRIVKRDASGDFSANAITATRFIGAISGAASSATIANTANALTTGRTISLGGDLSGSATFDGSQNITITATVAADSVALGTDTTGNYLANVVPGTGLTGTNFGTEGATPTLSLATSGVTANTYGGASKIPVLTIDTYGRVTSAANVAVAGVSNFTSSGNTFTITTSDGGTYSATIQLDAVRLGTDTTGAYVANLVQGTGISLTGLASESATPTIALATSGVTASTYGAAAVHGVFTVDTYGRITSASNVTATVANSNITGNIIASQIQPTGVTASTYGAAAVHGVFTVDAQGRITSAANVTATVANSNITGNIIASQIQPTGVTAGTYGGAAVQEVITVDAQGRITSAANVSIAIPSSALTTDVALGSQTSGAYVANLVAGTGITLTGLGNEGATPTITNSGVTSIAGTSNQITASAGTGSVTLSLPSSLTAPGDLTVTGNLYVNGTAVTMDTQTVVVEDPLVKFGNANPADSFSIGFYGEYTSTGKKYTGLYRDSSDGKYRLFSGLTSDPVTNAITAANVTIATLVANLSGGTVSGLTSNIAVSDGGTGRGTITTNAVLYGQGTSAVGLATGSAGQVLQLNASGVPIFGGLDGGTY